MWKDIWNLLKLIFYISKIFDIQKIYMIGKFESFPIRKIIISTGKKILYEKRWFKNNHKHEEKHYRRYRKQYRLDGYQYASDRAMADLSWIQLISFSFLSMSNIFWNLFIGQCGPSVDRLMFLDRLKDTKQIIFSVIISIRLTIRSSVNS